MQFFIAIALMLINSGYIAYSIDQYVKHRKDEADNVSWLYLTIVPVSFAAILLCLSKL